LKIEITVTPALVVSIASSPIKDKIYLLGYLRTQDLIKSNLTGCYLWFHFVVGLYLVHTV